MKQQIILAADHAGFKLKEKAKKHLENRKIAILDVGAHELTPDDDYPVYMADAAMRVARDLEGKTRAIIFGGSGQGEAMVANRFPGVRAAVWYGGSRDIIKLSREHNDANVLSIGARFVSESEATKAIDEWLDTAFSNNEKHERRIQEIDSVE